MVGICYWKSICVLQYCEVDTKRPHLWSHTQTHTHRHTDTLEHTQTHTHSEHTHTHTLPPCDPWHTARIVFAALSWLITHQLNYEAQSTCHKKVKQLKTSITAITRIVDPRWLGTRSLWARVGPKITLLSPKSRQNHMQRTCGQIPVNAFSARKKEHGRHGKTHVHVPNRTTSLPAPTHPYSFSIHTPTRTLIGLNHTHRHSLISLTNYRHTLTSCIQPHPRVSRSCKTELFRTSVCCEALGVNPSETHPSSDLGYLVGCVPTHHQMRALKTEVQRNSSCKEVSWSILKK